MSIDNRWVKGAEVGAIHTAHKELFGAFIFHDTPEGGDYWYGIVLRLREMEKIARKAKSTESPADERDRRGSGEAARSTPQ